MASVNGSTVDSWSGTIQRPTKPVEVHARTGVAGIGYTVGSAIAVPSNITTVSLYASTALAQAGAASANALVGSVVSVTDAAGVTHATTLVVQAQTAVSAVTGVSGVGAALTVQWTFMAEA